MNAMLVVAWHIVRTVVINIDRFVILCRSSNSTGQFFDHTAGDRRQHRYGENVLHRH